MAGETIEEKASTINEMTYWRQQNHHSRADENVAVARHATKSQKPAAHQQRSP